MIQTTPKIASALAVARGYPEELVHLEQVARLSGMLFDALEPLHGMGSYERELLCCAALLHDIGISISYSGHHKKSLRLILQSDLPALTVRERETVANVARYHRKAKPSKRHGAFGGLPADDRRLVRGLAAILRVADGLDRAQESAVGGLTGRIGPGGLVTIEIDGGGDLSYAAWGARRKAGLFEEVYGVSLGFEARGRGA